MTPALIRTSPLGELRGLPVGAARRRAAHVLGAWFALCISWGLANHQIMMNSSWRLAYDLAVVAPSVVAAVLALVLLCMSPDSRPFGFLRTFGVDCLRALGLRGVAGLAVDGLSDLIWSPTFVAGGLLFGLVASDASPRARTTEI